MSSVDTRENSQPVQWITKVKSHANRRDMSQVGSVLDVEMTMLDKQSKGIPIDEQANDDVVHLD